MDPEDQAALAALEVRLRTILPEEYQDTYDEVEPVSMGSAGLKFGSDGKVEWDEIWDHFCDLAMAGGPPHKGKLLEPGPMDEIHAQPERYRQVVAEICRGVRMVTELAVEPAPVPGWVRMSCGDDAMAAWLVRAIVMENISVHLEGATISLPAGPRYRIEKEIKNVVTVMAKTSHYWLGHMWSTQQEEAARLFAELEAESPLMQPALAGYGYCAESHRRLSGIMGEAIRGTTGLGPSDCEYAGWLGVECPDVHAAIWMMRALVVANVLSRREGTVLFLPVNPSSDPKGEIVVRAFVRIYGFAAARNVL